MKAEAIIAGREEEEEGWDEIPKETAAREVFDALLGEARREVNPKLPSHDDAVFFWANRSTAVYRKSILSHSLYPLVILEAASTKIPCTLYQADIRLSDGVFTICYADPYILAQVVIDGLEPDEEVAISLKEADAIAREYYKSMKPWDGSSNPDLEILAPCTVPPEAIVFQPSLLLPFGGHP
ncbi:MAG: hypothetical protein ABIH46_02395 [Chloroflexota bacterium]